MSEDSDMVNAREEFVKLTMACLTIPDRRDEGAIAAFISDAFEAGWCARRKWNTRAEDPGVGRLRWRCRCEVVL